MGIHNRVTNIVKLLLLGTMTVAGPLQATAADLLIRFIEEASRDDHGRSAQSYLDSLSAEQVLALGEQMALAHERERAYNLKGKTVKFKKSGESLFYEFAAVFGAYNKKALVSADAPAPVIRNPAKSLLWKNMITEFYTSSLSPLSKTDRKLLEDAAVSLRQRSVKDRAWAAKLNVMRTKRVRDSMDSFGRSTPADQLRQRRATLAPAVSAHMREIMADLSSKPALDSLDVEALTVTFGEYADMGFDPNRTEATDLAKRLFADTRRVDLRGRVKIASFLASRLGETTYYGELEKIRLAPENQDLLKPRVENGIIRDLGELIDDLIMSQVHDYDSALAFMKRRGPEDFLFLKSNALILKFRRQMEKDGTWTKEKAKELLEVYESKFPQAVSQARKELIESNVHELTRMAEGSISSSTSLPAGAD